MGVLIPEVLSIFFHSLSFLLGLMVVKKNEALFTREEAPKKCWFTVDAIEAIYIVVVLSLITNIWFIYNQIDWMVGEYDKNLKDMIYLQWMWYHVGTGISVCMLHLTIHWFLKNIKVTTTTEQQQEKTNWKL